MTEKHNDSLCRVGWSICSSNRGEGERRML